MTVSEGQYHGGRWSPIGIWSKQRIIDLSFWLWTYHLWPNVIYHSQWQKFMDKTLKKMSLTMVNDKKIVIYWKWSILLYLVHSLSPYKYMQNIARRWKTNISEKHQANISAVSRYKLGRWPSNVCDHVGGNVWQVCLGVQTLWHFVTGSAFATLPLGHHSVTVLSPCVW